jgi:hypothetical protein
MNKLITILFSVFVVLSVSAFPVLAADSGAKPSNVTITVLMPDKTPPPVEKPEPALITMFPIDVTEIRDGSEWQIIKTYELNALERPEDIPQGSFERNASSGVKWVFTLTDILRKESSNAETREHTETVTLDTDTKELEQILTLLSPTLEYRDDGGFAGILSLDVSSIKVESAGTKTSSHTMTITREYPHLSSNDTGLVPKTVEDKGKTYTLAGVNWRAGNTVTVDYTAVPEYYTAVATYTATGYSTKVTGYITTAIYSGMLGKLSEGKTTYIAFFLGEEIRTPLEFVTPSPIPEPIPTPVPTPAPTPEPEPMAVPEPEPEPELTAEPEPAAALVAEEPDASEPDEDLQDMETDKQSNESDAADELPQETDDEKNNNFAWFFIIPCLGILVGGAYYFIKMRKENPNDEKTYYPGLVVDDDDIDGDDGFGG